MTKTYDAVEDRNLSDQSYRGVFGHGQRERSTLSEFLNPFSGEAISPEWLTDVLKKLEKISVYQKDWYSYGSEPIHRSSIQSALQIIENIIPLNPPPPSVGPTPSGGVQIEWNEKNFAIEIETHPNNTVSVYFEEGEDYDEQEYDLHTAIRVIHKLVSRLKEIG